MSGDWFRDQIQDPRSVWSSWFMSVCLGRNGQEQGRLGTGRVGLWLFCPCLCNLRLIWGSAEPWGSPFFSLSYRGLDWDGSWGLLRLWHSESMNSKDTRQVRADHHVGSSHLSLPSVSAPCFQHHSGSSCQLWSCSRTVVLLHGAPSSSKLASLPLSASHSPIGSWGLLWIRPLIHFSLFAFRLKLLTRTKRLWWWGPLRRAASFHWGGKAVQRTRHCAQRQFNQERRQETETHAHTHMHTHKHHTLLQPTEAKPPFRKKASSILFQPWMHPHRASAGRTFWTDLGFSRVWLAREATFTFPEGLEWDFLRLKEKPPFFPPALQVSSRPLARSRLQVSCLCWGRMWPRKRACVPENSHKDPSVRRQDGLGLSERSPWQGLAPARRSLSCPPSFSLN